MNNLHDKWALQSCVGEALHQINKPMELSIVTRYFQVSAWVKFIRRPLQYSLKKMKTTTARITAATSRESDSSNIKWPNEINIEEPLNLIELLLRTKSTSSVNLWPINTMSVLIQQWR